MDRCLYVIIPAIAWVEGGMDGWMDCDSCDIYVVNVCVCVVTGCNSMNHHLNQQPVFELETAHQKPVAHPKPARMGNQRASEAHSSLQDGADLEYL